MIRLASLILCASLASSLFAREDMPVIPGPRDSKPAARETRETRPSSPIPSPPSRDSRNTDRKQDRLPVKPEPISMKGDRPEIPAPGNRVQFEQKEEIRDFPALQYSGLLSDLVRLEAERKDLDRETAIHREQELRERLRLLFPRGLYRFGAGCPLRKMFSASSIEFRIACLGDEVQNRIRFSRGRSDAIRNAFEFLSEGREITADMQLLEASVGSGGVDFVFRERSFQYQNRFLEALRDSTHLAEPDLLEPEWISRKLPALLALKFSEVDLAPVREVLSAGSWIPFHESCPLRLRSITLLNGEASYRVELTPACLPGRTAVIRVAEQALNDETALQSDTGTPLYGELRLAGIVLVDGQIYLDWDGVRNVRREEK